MQYNSQTNDEFRCRWNNCKDNNQKRLRSEDHKQAGLFTHFQTAGHSGFINDTEVRFIDKMDPSDPTRHEDFWIDTLKFHYLQGLHDIDPYHHCFCILTSYHRMYGKCFCFCSFRFFFLRGNSLFTCYFYFSYLILLFLFMSGD